MNPQRSRRSAFTLLELLIAAGITAVIVVMLGMMFGSLTSTSSRANQRTDAFREARAALQMITRDLSNLVRTQWQPDPFTSPTPATTPQSLTRAAAYFALDNRWVDTTNDPYSDPTQTYCNRQLYALISIRNSGSSDVCSVGYYCNWNGSTYSLRRFFRPSDQTYAILSSPAPTPTPTPAGAPTVYISGTNLYQPNPSPSPIPTDDVLASHVWNLRINAYDKSGAIINPETVNSVIRTKIPYVCDGSATDPTAPIGNPAPAAIEISFNALSPQAARALIAATAARTDAYKVWMASVDPGSSPTDQQLYQRLIAPHVYEFRTRIKL